MTQPSPHDDLPAVGQNVRFLVKGKTEWKKGKVSLIWKYDGLDCVDIEGGGTFFPEWDQWSVDDD